MANCSAQCATEQYKKMRHTSLHRNCTLPVFFYWVLFIFFSFYIEQFVNCSFFCVSGIARITAQYTICVLFVPRQCTIDWFLLNQQPHSHTQLTGGEQTFCKSFPKKKRHCAMEVFSNEFPWHLFSFAFRSTLILLHATFSHFLSHTHLRLKNKSKCDFQRNERAERANSTSIAFICFQISSEQQAAPSFFLQ